MQRRIGESAYRFQQRVESVERVVVGVNRFQATATDPVEIMKIGPQGEEEQIRELQKLRAERDNSAVEQALDRLEEVARGEDNLLPPLKEALAAYATVGECAGRLRQVFGEYEAPELV
jgi:methylmalonyl-CoA mutase N-terminal domain/subunit